MIIRTIDMFEQTFELYHKHFRTIFSYSLLTLLPGIAGFMLLAPLFFLSGISFANDNRTFGYGSLILAAISVIALLVLSVLITTALFRVVAKFYTGKATGRMRKELRAVMPVMGTVILTNVIVSVLVVLGTVLFFIPGVLAGVYFGFAFYLAMIDGLQPIDAMKRSISLVRGRFWQVLWLFFISTAVAIMLIVVIQAVITSPFSYLTKDVSSLATLIALNSTLGVLQYLTIILITPLAYIAQIIIFENAKSAPLKTKS